jgi:hypothetical protein
MNDFLVYMWLREDGTPYYIGKTRAGRGCRAFTSAGHKVHCPTKPANIRVKFNLTEEQAFAREINLIAQFGRKDLATGILRNMTDGGEGLSGLVFTEEHRQNIATALTGKPKSPEHAIKCRESLKKAKPVPRTPEQRDKIASRVLHDWEAMSPAEREQRGNATRDGWLKRAAAGIVHPHVASGHLDRIRGLSNHIRHHVKGWYSKKTGRNHPPRFSSNCSWCEGASNVTA